MAKKLIIPFGNHNIVAEINTLNLPEIPPELCVYITDNNGRIVQDICLVRQQYECNGNGKDFTPYDAITCLVWSDSDNEDFTHDFGINIYNEEE